MKYRNKADHKLGRMKGLVVILGVAVLMAVVGGCGSNELDTGDGQMEIAQALEAAEGSEVTVSGFLIADWDGNTRLCSVLFESLPPQCGGDRIDLLGFDASSVSNSKTLQRPSIYIQTARWTDSQITVTGIRVIGGLAEVRLSTPAPSTVGGTAPTESSPRPPNTPIVSHGGPVKDYVSLVDTLRATGATVDPAGTESADFLAPQTQVLTVNGERVKTFEFASAEEADAAAEGVSATGDTITTTFADGTKMGTSVTWNEPPHFHKAGKLIVLYVGCDGDVIDALQETMGPQFAGGAGVSQCP